MNLLHYNYCIEMWTERLQCVYMYILWLTVDIMRLTSAGISLNLRIKACLTQSTKISAPNTITASGRITHTCSKHKNTTNFLVNTWKEAVNKIHLNLSIVSMSSFLRGSQENSVMFLMKTIARSTMYRNLSFTSLQEMWNRNPLSIFLKRLPFISTNWKQIKILKNIRKKMLK